ncbi:MAG: exosortase [Pseudomonadota bacterium]
MPIREPVRNARAQTPGPTPMPLLAGAGVLAAFFLPAAAHLGSVWVTSSAHHHCLLALPLTLWLLRRDGAVTRDDRAVALGGTAIGGFGLALLITGLGYLYDLKIAQHAGVYIALLAVVAGYLGRAGLRQHASTLFFLGFMVPVGDALIPPLQGLTTDTIQLLGRWTGMGIAREGYLLTTEAGRFVVAEACAGMRFLMAALMLGTFYAHLCRFSWRCSALFLSAAAVMALAANGLRAFFMVWLATLSDMRWGVGLDHYYFGWLIYLAMFFALYALGTRLRPTPEHAG